jgi:hypothetical protein
VSFLLLPLAAKWRCVWVKRWRRKGEEEEEEEEEGRERRRRRA